MSGSEITSSNDDASFAKANRKQLLIDTGTNIEAAGIAGSGQTAWCTETLGSGRKEKGQYYSVNDFGQTWTRTINQLMFPVQWGSFNPASTTHTDNVDGFLRISASSGTLSIPSIDTTQGCFVRYTTGSSIGNTSGFNIAKQQVSRQHNPFCGFKIRLGQTTNERVFLGFTSSTSILGNTDDPLNAIGGVMLAKLTTSSNWRIIHNDGAGVTVSDDTTVPVGTGVCWFRLYGDEGDSAFYWTVETTSTSASGTITTDIPSGSSYLSFQATLITTTAAAINWDIFEGFVSSQR